MEYSYVAYTKDRKLVKGKLSATNQEAAAGVLSYGGYQVLALSRWFPSLMRESWAPVSLG